MKSLQKATSKFKLLKKKIHDLPIYQQNSNPINYKPTPQTHRPTNQQHQQQTDLITSRPSKQSLNYFKDVSEETQRKSRKTHLVEYLNCQPLILKKQKTLKQINDLLDRKQQILKELEISIKTNSIKSSRRQIIRNDSSGKWINNQIKAPNINQIRFENKKKSLQKSIQSKK